MYAQKVTTLSKFQAEGANQAVAADQNFLYVIDNSVIAKYSKKDLKLIDSWEGRQSGPIRHLNSGIIINGKLYCANSNYPEIPMASSIEVFNPETMEHIDNHSFGIVYGSATWVDFHEGFWWVCFAHYNGDKSEFYKNSGWTQLVKFDTSWRRMEGWLFPKELINLFQPKSNSGGAWGSDGYLYLAGHDKGELYKVRIPEQGFELELVKIISIESQGQGFAFDPTESGIVYTIKRKTKEVVRSSITFD